MKKEYVLQGLGCANCAGKIENGVKALDGIKFVSVNFITGTMSLETDERYHGSIYSDIETIVHKFEPDITIVENKQGDITFKDYASIDKSKLGMIILGAFVFVLGIFLEVSEALKIGIFLTSYMILGGNVVLSAFKNITSGQLFDENFLMSVATVGAVLIGEYPEAVAVMLFYQIGEYFQDAAVRKSKRSISDLMDIRPDFANIKKDGEIIRANPDTVCPGDIIMVKPGEKIPLDGIIIDGTSSLDTRALTGESAFKDVGPADAVISGCVNQNGVLLIKVTKAFGESTVSKIIDMVENAAAKKASAENFITAFSKYYTPAVVGLCALIAIIPPVLFGGGWGTWINRGLVVLVISCPCALVISIPLGFFAGIGTASRKGILVKGSNFLEALSNLDIVVFDKTGTLTKGVFEVSGIFPANGCSSEELLLYSANAETFSNHPIALSVLKAYGKSVDDSLLKDYKEMPGYGVSVTACGKNILSGNEKLMKDHNILFEEPINAGTKIYVAVDNEYVGCILISDMIKPDSLDAVSRLKEKGVQKTVMLTGDSAKIGEDIAKRLCLDEVYSELLPHQKVEKIEEIDSCKKPKGKLAFVGDGINDAPVLKRADIGIAMGGLGSDAAIEAADVVLMTDEPSKLIDAIDVARKTKRIVWQNIVFALGIKIIVLLLGAFGFAGMWQAVFADVGVSVLAILNSLRIMSDTTLKTV